MAAKPPMGTATPPASGVGAAPANRSGAATPSSAQAKPAASSGGPQLGSTLTQSKQPASASTPATNPWSASAKAQRAAAAAAAAAGGGAPAAKSGTSTPTTTTSAPSNAVSTSNGTATPPASAAASQGPAAGARPRNTTPAPLQTTGPAATGNGTPAPSTPTSVAPGVRELSTLLGKALKLTTANGTVAHGLLWCYDAASGTVVLETASGSGSAGSSSSAAELVSTPYSASLSHSQRRTDVSAPRAGFRILKARDIRSVDALSQGTADGLGLPRELSMIDPTVATPAAAEAREQAAVRDIKLKATRIGKGVSTIGQTIFDALSKTLPCRWHEQHIIVMDEVVIHGPQYDASSTKVPGITDDQLRAISEGSTPASLSISINEARAKANSWTRVVKVLEGERRRISAREGTAAAS